MAKEQILEKMTFILYGDNLKRLGIKYDKNGNPVIYIDLHDMKYKETMRLLENIIAMFRFPFTLIAIHGYNHGTILKTAINEDLINTRIKSRYTPAKNQGITYLNIA